jgi:hypothetical protein
MLMRAWDSVGAVSPPSFESLEPRVRRTCSASGPRVPRVEFTPGSVEFTPGSVEFTPGSVEITPGSVELTPGSVESTYRTPSSSWMTVKMERGKYCTVKSDKGRSRKEEKRNEMFSVQVTVTVTVSAG